MSILSKASISEVLLLFVLLFIIPSIAYLIVRLRKYENVFGMLPGEKVKAKAEPKPEAKPQALPENSKASIDNNLFPYKEKDFLAPGEKSCLSAMREALGEDVDVFPKVAIWTMIDSTEKDAGYRERLFGKIFDYLVCDRHTGHPLTAVMFNPAKGMPIGSLDELKEICSAASVNIVFIDPADEYDGKKLKEMLGIPELDI